MTKKPYNYAFTIEYDREVITVRLYDNWLNKTIFIQSSTTNSPDELINEAYNYYKTMKGLS